MRNTQYLALVKMAKKAGKLLSWIFHSATLLYPLHPQMGADGGRSQVLIHFHFLEEKNLVNYPSHLLPPGLPPVGFVPHLVPPAGLQVGQGRGDLHPMKKRKLSLSNQLVPLVHALGVDLAPAVQAGQLTVVDYPVLLF